MTRQVTDQLYIELDYYYPEDFYVYTAEAQSAIQSESTVTCDVSRVVEATSSITSEFTQTVQGGRSVDAQSTMSAEFTQTVQGYRTIEIVLSAFSEGTLASSISRLRDYNSSLSDEFDIAIDYVRLLSALGDLSSEFTQVTDSERSRDFESVQSAAFSLAATTTIIPAFIEGSAALSSEFAQTTDVARTRYALADLNVEAAQTTTVDRLRYGVGDLAGQSDVAVTVTRIIQTSASISDAFTATLSANASKNLTAALDSQTTLAVDGTKTGTLTAGVSAEFTQTTQADRFAEMSATLNSQFTLTADVSRNRLSAVSVSSTFTQTATPEYILLYRDAVRISYSGTNARISNVEKKFGSFSLKTDDVTGANPVLPVIKVSDGSSDIYDFDANDWTIEFFYRDNEDTSSGEVFESILSVRNNSDSPLLNLYKRNNATANSNIYQLEGPWTNTTPITGTYAISTWRHIALTYTASTKGLAFYIDGSRIGTKTFSTGWTNASRFVFGGLGLSYALSNAYIDELRISDQVRYTGTSFTVPTTQFAKNRKDIALFKFEEEYLSGSLYYSDSETTQQSGQAALSSEFTQTTAAIRNRTANGSLTSSFALTAVVGTIEEITTSMFDDVELTAIASVTRDVASAQSSSFTQTTAVNRTRTADSTQSSEFTQTADANRTRTAASTQASSFTQVVDGDLVADITASINSAFTQSVQGARTRSTAVAANSEFTQSTDNSRVRYFDSTQSSEFAVTAEAERVQEASADLNTEFIQVSDVERFRSSSVDLNTESSVTATVNRVRYGLSDQSSEFTQVVDAVRIQQGSADISAEFTQVTDAARTRNLDSTQTSTTQVVANIVKTVDVVIATEAVATQLTAAAKIGDFLIDCAVTATVACNGSRVRFFANLSEARGVNLQNDVTGTDLGPFLLLPTYTGGTSLTVTRSLISFWCNQGTTGAILNTDGIYDGNPSGTNILEIREESGNYFLYYYGNRAEAGIYPYVKWAINYTKEDLLHNFLLYIKPGVLNEPSDVSQYKFYLDGVEQTLIEVTNAYVEPKQKHTFTIKDALLLGYGSSFYAAGAQSGYQPYKNLENTAPNSAVLAQFWMDNNTDYDITDSTLRNKFYNNGWTDLGHDGTATGLPQPDYYVRLQGYEDLNDGGTQTTNDWSWKYFNNRRTAVDRLVYDVTDFTATPDQDNPYVTQIVARLSATSIGVYLFAANLQSTSTLTATVERIQANNAAISSEFSVTANITVNIGTITDIPAEFSLNALGGYLLSGQSNQNSQFTVAVLAGSIGDNNIDMLSAFTVQADVNVIPPVRTAADLSSQFALTAVTGFEQQAQAQLNSEFAVQADATEIPPIRIEANLTSAFAVTASLQGQFDNQAQLNSQFTEVATGQRLRRPSANLQAQANVTTIISTLVGFEANLPVVASTLIVGSTISIDPFYQFKVEPESRRGTVLPENRVFQVESETRLNMIL